MARVVRNCDVVFKSSVMLCRLTRHYPQANYARRLLPSYRHFSSILPKFPFDPKEWPSTLPSTKGVVNLETLQAQLQKAGVKYLAPSFLDMHGIPKTKMVPVDHLISCSRGSELFTGAALDGVPQAISDDEVCAVADPTTMAVQLPYQREVCYMPASLYYHGTPFESCSRNIYARVAERAKAKGFLMKLGIEAEFFVLRDDDEEGNMRSSRFKPPKQEPISALETMHHPVYDLSRLIDNLPWMGQLVDAMNELGWGVYSFDHEDAVGQFEVDFQFCEAGLMADRFVLLRMMTCAIAREHGSYASWMPKPMQNRTGSGAHLNVSLHDFNDDKEINLFRPSSDNTSDGQEESEQLSELGRYFLGGVMAHLDAITAVTW
jgi:glutamine synthetase